MHVLLALCLQASDGIDAASKDFDRACREYEESLVELGPAAAESLAKSAETLDSLRGRIVWRAVERIEKDRKKLERLVEDLGAAEIEVRDRATHELLKIGRPARSYLVKASGAANPEVVERAKLLLLRLRHAGPNRARWAAAVEIETARVARLKEMVDRGMASPVELADVERTLLRARCKAGQLSLPEFLKQEQGRSSAELQRVTDRYERGVASAREVMESKIRAAFVELRLGKGSETELWDLQANSAVTLRSLFEKGVLSSAEYEKGLEAIMQDPYEDLEQERP